MSVPVHSRKRAAQNAKIIHLAIDHADGDDRTLVVIWVFGSHELEFNFRRKDDTSL